MLMLMLMVFFILSPTLLLLLIAGIDAVNSSNSPLLAESGSGGDVACHCTWMGLSVDILLPSKYSSKMMSAGLIMTLMS